MSRVTKKQIVQSLVEKNKFTHREALKAVDAVIDAITAGLVAGSDVNLSNVGTLRRETAPERLARNPQTGVPVIVPEREVVRWTMSPTLSDVLNGRQERESLARKAPKSL